MGQIHVDDMTLEILCTNLSDVGPKSVGAVAKNVFCKRRLEEGHVRNLEVVICILPSKEWACAKFGINRCNGC